MQLREMLLLLLELAGYCANSDGYDMVSPSGEGATRCMNEALTIYGGDIDYINAHGTSTPVGDLAELGAIKNVFGDSGPIIGSTKSMTGHSLGATGAQEAIYSILMMQNNFIAPSINIDNLVEEAEGLKIAQNNDRARSKCCYEQLIWIWRHKCELSFLQNKSYFS